jgi:hypothetical protein
MNKKTAEEKLRKIERDMFIYFAKGVMLYRITEENKQRVFKNWNSEDFEVELHAATNACNEMRDGVDENLGHLIEIVPEISAYAAELKEMFNKQKKEHEQENKQK